MAFVFFLSCSHRFRLCLLSINSFILSWISVSVSFSPFSTTLFLLAFFFSFYKNERKDIIKNVRSIDNFQRNKKRKKHLYPTFHRFKDIFFLFFFCYWSSFTYFLLFIFIFQGIFLPVFSFIFIFCSSFFFLFSLVPGKSSRSRKRQNKGWKTREKSRNDKGNHMLRNDTGFHSIAASSAISRKELRLRNWDCSETGPCREPKSMLAVLLIMRVLLYFFILI